MFSSLIHEIYSRVSGQSAHTITSLTTQNIEIILDNRHKLHIALERMLKLIKDFISLFNMKVQSKPSFKG